MTIIPAPDWPQESLQKVFRDPAMFEQVVGAGVAVGQGAFGGQFFRSHAASRNAAVISAQRAAIEKKRFMLFRRQPIADASGYE
jgi:hypothetical protein